MGETLFEHMAVLGPIFTADNLTDGLINMNDVLQPMSVLAFLFSMANKKVLITFSVDISGQ